MSDLSERVEALMPERGLRDGRDEIVGRWCRLLGHAEHLAEHGDASLLEVMERVSRLNGNVRA